MKYQGPEIRQPGLYNTHSACEECCVADFGPSLTQQNQSDDANINTIVKRFGLTGKLPENVPPVFNADFEEAFDFRTAHNAIIEARNSFNTMPPNIRARFANDPGEFVDFCSNPENMEEMVRLGLAIQRPPEKPPETPPAPPTGPTGTQPT